MNGFRDTGLVVVLFGTFCPAGPVRQGTLSSVADSLLPRGAQQTCVTVPAQLNVAYRTGYVRCWTEPDTNVTVEMSMEGVVRYLEMRVPRDAADSLEQTLRAQFGEPGTPCDYGTRFRTVAWRGDGYDVELVAMLSEPHALVAYNLPRASMGALGCVQDLIPELPN